MKEKITKFDLDAAFKALNEIDIPHVNGLRKNRQNFTESVKKVDKLDLLMEDYYDVNDKESLELAQSERQEEVAQAKLDRIEKIVDLDADSPEDILPSYIGKTIIQCPQCMTLFYKAPEDVEASAENPSVVNVSEKCQHCGNESGYNIIGKVAAEDNTPAQESEVEEPLSDVTADEESVEEENQDQNLELDNADKLEPDESEESEEKKEESLEKETTSSLLEQIEKALNESEDKDLNKKLDEHNTYIEYLQNEIKKEEEALKNAKNEFIKDAIQRCLDALHADLDAAIPEEVKNKQEADNELEITTEIKSDAAEDATAELEDSNTEKQQNEPDGDSDESEKAEESLNKSEFLKNAEKDLMNTENHSKNLTINEDVRADLQAFANSLEDDPSIGEDLETDKKLDAFANSITEDSAPEELEEKAGDVTTAEFDSMINSPVFYEELEEDDIEELDDDSINSNVTNFLTEVYSNVDSFIATRCETTKNKLIIEGCINFKSGKKKNTAFTFVKENKKYKGINESISLGGNFELEYKIKDKVMTVENLIYRYAIDKNLVEGCTKK